MSEINAVPNWPWPGTFLTECVVTGKANFSAHMRPQGTAHPKGAAALRLRTTVATEALRQLLRSHLPHERIAPWGTLEVQVDQLDQQGRLGWCWGRLH